MRNAVELLAPGIDPAAQARALHDQLIPTPTDRGQQTVDDAIAKATQDPTAITIALTEAMVSTIVGVMQNVVADSKVDGPRPSPRQPHDRGLG